MRCAAVPRGSLTQRIRCERTLIAHRSLFWDIGQAWRGTYLLTMWDMFTSSRYCYVSRHYLRFLIAITKTIDSIPLRLIFFPGSDDFLRMSHHIGLNVGQRSREVVSVSMSRSRDGIETHQRFVSVIRVSCPRRYFAKISLNKRDWILQLIYEFEWTSRWKLSRELKWK